MHHSNDRFLSGNALAIKLTTEIKISVGVAFSLAVVLFAGFWAISQFVFAEVKDDVAFIREDVSTLRARSDEKVTMLETSSDDIEKALILLAAKLDVTNERLKDLSQSLQAVDQRLTDSIQRQQDFERFIVTGLPTPADVPKDWVQSRKAIITKISSGTDPLLKWYQAVPFKK